MCSRSGQEQGSQQLWLGFRRDSENGSIEKHEHEPKIRTRILVLFQYPCQRWRPRVPEALSAVD